MRSLVLAALVLTTTAGCSANADKGKAQAAVAEFRQMSDAGRFAEIWQGGSGELKSSTSQDELVRVLSGLQNHYGNFRSASETNWHWNSNNGAVSVTLEYDTEFAKDRASERFVYSIEGGAARLTGYNRRNAASPATPANTQ